MSPSRVNTITVVLVLFSLLASMADAAPVNEMEPNNFFAEAQNLNGNFTREFDATITDAMGNNTSTFIPHATVFGRGDNGPGGLGLDADYFRFDVSDANTQGIFDIDSVQPISTLQLYLFDDAGQLLAQSQSNAALGMAVPDTGSLSLNDPFLEYTFATAGLYFLGVAGTPSFGQNGGIVGVGPAPLDEYTLQASIALPEPASLLMFGASAAGLAFYRRRKSGMNVKADDFQADI